MMLEYRNITKKFGNKEAVKELTLKLKKGTIYGLLGENGSGKTTLLNMLGTIDSVTSGTILVDQDDITKMKKKDLANYRREKIGFIFQAFNLVPSLNVWENIILPIGLDDKKPDMPYLKEIIEMLGLTDKLTNLPNTLSGGQQQRVAIARALATKPAIILADEPTGNLDSKTSDEVMTLLKTSAFKYEQTLIVITHNEDIAQMGKRNLIITDGKVVEE